jgi:hypothetical protein
LQIANHHGHGAESGLRADTVRDAQRNELRRGFDEQCVGRRCGTATTTADKKINFRFESQDGTAEGDSTIMLWGNSMAE